MNKSTSAIIGATAGGYLGTFGAIHTTGNLTQNVFTKIAQTTKKSNIFAEYDKLNKVGNIKIAGAVASCVVGIGALIGCIYLGEKAGSYLHDKFQ